MIIQFLVSLAATLSFAVLFSAEKKQLFFCGLTGALGWIVYLICLQYHTDNAIANLIATFALTLVHGFFRQCAELRSRCSCSPGSSTCSGCRNLLYLLLLYHGRYEPVLKYGISTVKVAGSIVLGIIFGFALPQSLFNGLSKLAHKD